MRILHTESSTGWGGQENRTINELIGMRSLGHTLAVASRPGARILDIAKDNGFETFEVQMRNAADVTAIFKLRRLMTQWGSDIVNTHSGRDTQLAGMAAHTLGRKRPRVVRTRHLALPITSRFTYSVLPDQVVTVSHSVGNYLASAGVPRDQITVIPTGIDLSRYVAPPGGGSLRTELNLPPDAILIGTVAILRFKKGHADLLDAVPNVLATYPQAHFLLAGDGPMYSTLAEQIAAKGLSGKVHLLGLRRDIPNLLASLDLFVLPTHQEALGTAFIEAAAMGIPAIGTQVDGIPEVIVDGETGMLVPPRAPAHLSNAIVSMLSDRTQLLQMGANANIRVRKLFSREAMSKGMESLYQRLRDGQ